MRRPLVRERPTPLVAYRSQFRAIGAIRVFLSKLPFPPTPSSHHHDRGLNTAKSQDIPRFGCGVLIRFPSLPTAAAISHGANERTFAKKRRVTVELLMDPLHPAVDSQYHDSNSIDIGRIMLSKGCYSIKMWSPARWQVLSCAAAP